MKFIVVLEQKKEHLLFTPIGSSVYFKMKLSNLIFLSDISFEWFEEYLPNCADNPYSIYLTQDGSVRDEEDSSKNLLAK